jgi:hypothetical protein
MIDHRAVVGSLTPQQRLHLTTKSDGAGLRHFAFHGGAIILFGALIAARVPFWPLLMVPQGIVIVFLFTLLHETVHRTAFKTRALNDIVAGICALMIALPVEWFRAFHFAHHRFTQDPENDPELAGPKPETPKQDPGPEWLGAMRRRLRIGGSARSGKGRSADHDRRLCRLGRHLFSDRLDRPVLCLDPPRANRPACAAPLSLGRTYGLP